QAEDGIRDLYVTGVQTCALPIFPSLDLVRDGSERGPSVHHAARRMASVTLCPPNPKEFESATSTCRFTALLGAESRSQAGSGVRSEERRVGKEGRGGGERGSGRR